MLGIICGLESEAILARRIPNAMVACAAAQPHKARRLVRELIAQGATRLMSFGIAGGLEPGLPIGSMVIGTHVDSIYGLQTCDSDWVNGLIRKLPEAHSGGVWGSEFLVSSAAEKHALHQKSRCLIVDMESQCMAQIAMETRVPTAVVRAVCDSSDMDVPPLVMDAIAEDGSVNVPKALWSIVRQPWQMLRLIHVAKGTNAALTTLESSVSHIEDAI